MLDELGAAPSGLLDAVDAAGWTAAHHAAARRHGRVLDALLDMGCERGVDVFGAAVGAVLLESVVPEGEADRLRQRLVRGGDLVSTVHAPVVVN
jgi:hypothetical protein